MASPPLLITVQTIQAQHWHNSEDQRVTGRRFFKITARVIATSGEISWGLLIMAGLPFAVICTFATWGFLWLWYRPSLKYVDPVPSAHLQPLTWLHFLVLAVSVGTVILWTVNAYIENFVGQIGITALIPVVMYDLVALLLVHFRD